VSVAAQVEDPVAIATAEFGMALDQMMVGEWNAGSAICANIYSHRPAHAAAIYGIHLPSNFNKYLHLSGPQRLGTAMDPNNQNLIAFHCSDIGSQTTRHLRSVPCASDYLSASHSCS
jgi:hypothetical protein